MNTILSRARRNPNAAVVFISLMAKDAKHFFTWLQAIDSLSFDNSMFISFTHLLTWSIEVFKFFFYVLCIVLWQSFCRGINSFSVHYLFIHFSFYVRGVRSCVETWGWHQVSSWITVHWAQSLPLQWVWLADLLWRQAFWLYLLLVWK